MWYFTSENFCKTLVFALEEKLLGKAIYQVPTYLFLLACIYTWIQYTFKSETESFPQK